MGGDIDVLPFLAVALLVILLWSVGPESCIQTLVGTTRCRTAGSSVSDAIRDLPPTRRFWHFHPRRRCTSRRSKPEVGQGLFSDHT